MVSASTDGSASWGFRPKSPWANSGCALKGLRSPKANAGIGVALLERLYRRYGGEMGPRPFALPGRSAPKMRERPGRPRADAGLRGGRDGVVAAPPEGREGGGAYREMSAAAASALRAFPEAEGRFTREDRGRGMRFNLWYDDRGVRIEPAPLGQGRPCCAGARFFLVSYFPRGEQRP